VAGLGAHDLIEHLQGVFISALLAQHRTDRSHHQHVAGGERQRPAEQLIGAGEVARLLAPPRRKVQDHRVGLPARECGFGERGRTGHVIGGKRALDLRPHPLFRAVSLLGWLRSHRVCLRRPIFSALQLCDMLRVYCKGSRQ
jgi:hypothetical protein